MPPASGLTPVLLPFAAEIPDLNPAALNHAALARFASEFEPQPGSPAHQWIPWYVPRSLARIPDWRRKPVLLSSGFTPVRLAPSFSPRPLLVFSGFEPQPGSPLHPWIPWHAPRSLASMAD